MEHKLKCCCVWLWLRQGTALEPQLTEIHLHERGRLFFSTTPSTDRMQFYYWNCLLMIPNYPVEHSGEGQFQASNLCCNHRENHTCNTAVAFTSQQHKQKDRESESRVGVKKKKGKKCVGIQQKYGGVGSLPSREERDFSGEIETNLQNLHFIIYDIIWYTLVSLRLGSMIKNNHWKRFREEHEHHVFATIDRQNNVGGLFILRLEYFQSNLLSTIR